MTLYDIKPQFQALLRPLVGRLAAAGITANQVTLAAAVGSIIVSSILIIYADITALFVAIPIWMFLRMALNAIDGMLAREFQQQSHLGAYLNEVCDVVSDAALYLPFAWISPLNPLLISLFIFLAVLSEFVGVLGSTVGATRRYDGPLGKSDRALLFGAFGLWVAVAGQFPDWLIMIFPLLVFLQSLTIYNRTRRALAEIH